MARCLLLLLCGLLRLSGAAVCCTWIRSIGLLCRSVNACLGLSAEVATVQLVLQVSEPMSKPSARTPQHAVCRMSSCWRCVGGTLAPKTGWIVKQAAAAEAMPCCESKSVQTIDV